MKIAIDLNVLLDVAQNRPAFYQDSEEVLARAREGDYEGVIAGHLVTTFYYLLAKFSGAATGQGPQAPDERLRGWCCGGHG